MFGLGKGDTEAKQQRQAILDKVTREADAGRRLAIFDRDTGLYAHWYLNRRFTEESKRSHRYKRSLSVIVVEVPHTDGFSGRDRMTSYLSKSLRDSDIASHLGDGRYLVYLPETTPESAANAADRIRAHATGALTGISAYGADGEELDALQAAAEANLDESRPTKLPESGAAANDSGIVDLRSFKDDEPKLSVATS